MVAEIVVEENEEAPATLAAQHPAENEGNTPLEEEAESEPQFSQEHE